MNIGQLSERRSIIVAEAHRIISAAKAAGDRAFTDDEKATLHGKRAEMVDLDARIEAAKVSQDFANMIGDISGSDGSGQQSLGLFGQHARNLAGKIAAGIRGSDHLDGSVKALLPAGTVSTTITMADSPIALGKVPQNLLSILPVAKHASPRYAYMRQVSRTNNAAPVPVAGTKPTSVFGLTRVEADLAVVAHLSEPIDSYWLSDAPSLQRFVQDELLYGLAVAVENQWLNGTGTAPALRGVLNTSGIQVQAAVGTDLFATTRAAVTLLETAGQIPAAWVMTPTDWARFELARNVSGQFDLGPGAGPVDRAARKLWGIQVVVSTTIAAGTVALLDLAAVALDTDEQGVTTQWAAMGTDFAQNQVRARTEGRFGVSVFQPLGVAKVTLPA